MVVSPISIATMNPSFDILFRFKARWILSTSSLFEVTRVTASKSPVSLRRESRVEPRCLVLVMWFFFELFSPDTVTGAAL